MNQFSSIAIAVGIALSGLFISTGIVKFKKMDRSVEVRGLAERAVEADLAMWTVTFSVAGEQLTELNAKVLSQQNTVVSFLKEQGLKDDEIFKRPSTMSDRVTQEYGNQKGPRYIVRGSVAVKSNRPQLISEISAKTDVLLKQGISLGHSDVEFYFTALNEVKPSMLEEATQNAKAAAQSFAKNTGASVGTIRKAYQGLFSIGSSFADYDNRTSMQKKVRVVVTIDFNLD